MGNRFRYTSKPGSIFESRVSHLESKYQEELFVKRFMLTSRKVLSFLLAFIIVFSLFSDVMVVHGATAADIRFFRIKEIGSPIPFDTLYINGSGFTNPTVLAGETGSIPIKINKEKSTPELIVIDDQDDLKSYIVGKPNTIKVYNDGTEATYSKVFTIDLTSIPTPTSISKNKAYVGDPLTVDGNQFGGLVAGVDRLYVAGRIYPLAKPDDGDDEDPVTADIVGSSIEIAAVESPNTTGVANVEITKLVGVEPNRYTITSILSDCITVVNEISGIDVERVDPNAGPRDKNNIVSIYGKDGASKFRSDMRIFVDEMDISNEGRFIEVITDSSKKEIGITFELPTRATSGTVDLIIATGDLTSGLVIPSAFVYLNIGNNVIIDREGINPNFKKETEDKIVEIKGRNIGFFNGTGYDKISNVTIPSDVPLDKYYVRYDEYGDYTMFDNSNYYKIRYKGIYDDTDDVTIIRQFRFTINEDATVVDSVYSSQYEPNFDISKDKIFVRPANVTMDIKEPTKVDVSVETKTTIFREVVGPDPDIIYSRTEKYVLEEGFQYLPNETSPTITSVTPDFGPSGEEIYMTIKGSDFEVLEDGSKPVVMVGTRICTVTGVYDDMNEVVDGNFIKLGTKIKCILPAGTPLNGAVDVVVTNPSEGLRTLDNGFNFKNPADDEKMPYIDSLKENYGDLRGGDISGERVLITGGNFFTSADDIHRLVITIDGEKAIVVGKVSSDGKTVTIIPPPGTVAGPTQLQLINEDGSMVSANFEYKLVTSNPKITSIVPIKGGKGTKLIIKGEDFVLPDDSVGNDDSKRKGSVVLLGGIELNAYKYDDEGVITNRDPMTGDITTSIYYDDDEYDADGNPLTDNSLDGHMTKVQDITTIYVDIPDRYYSFKAGVAPAAPIAPYLKSDLIPKGLLKVEVLNPDGAKSKENITFNYMIPSTSPIIADINPNSGSVAGGTVVTIIGSGFKQEYLEVYFGSEKSENVEFINSTLIRATVPDYPYTLPTGQDYLDVPVMLMNYDGGAAVYFDEDAGIGFKYKVPSSNPVIDSIINKYGLPEGSSAGNDSVFIEGLDFRRTPDMALSGLPKVYFNGQQAEVIWPAGNTTTIAESLKVITPPSLTSGVAEVILVNHDSGTCIFKGFTYIMSKPVITTIMPDKISKNGNVNIQINGSDFREGDLTQLFSSAVERVDRNVDSSVYEQVYAEEVIETIVALGDEETGDKKMIDTVLGPMETEIGDLGFECEIVHGVTEQVRIWIYHADDNTHSVIPRNSMVNGVKTFDSWAEAYIPVGSSHLFIINHNMDLNMPNIYDEGIFVETTPSSVTITRRIAAYANIEYERTRLTVKAPPTDMVGVRKLYVINDDGGTATGEITIMNPDSSPVITRIDPRNYARERDTQKEVEYVPGDIDDYSELFTLVPLDGGAFLTISGADFRKNVKVYLDDKPLEIVSKSIDDDQLVIKVPPGTTADLGKDLRIVVVNDDSGTYDSSMLEQPHYIRYQTQGSNPVIESIVPDETSSRGSNNIVIHGELFKAGVQVFIDGIEGTVERGYLNEDGVRIKESEYLTVSVPTGLTPGKKTVQLLNNDFGFVEVQDGLTIISSPEITGIFDDEGDAINPLVLSVEGGERIKLTGIQFLEGMQVIFGGILKAKSELKDGESGIEGLNINNAEMVIIGGTIAAEVTLQADGSVLCTTPKLNMGTTSVIVINSDRGISNEITGVYQKPVPDTPGGIKVEVVDGDTFKLEWDKIENVNYYEIYVSISENGKSSSGIYQYLGSIVPSEISETRLRYYLDGLMPSTWYNIRLRSINLFGASKFSTSTGYNKTLDEKVVTFYQDETASTGAVEQKDSAVMNGLELIYNLGEKSIGSSTGAVVNFEQPSYIIANPKVVKVSFELIKRYPNNKIKINDKDMEIVMKASNLAVDDLIVVSSSLKNDTDLRISINRSLGAEGDEIRIKMPRGYKIMINPFSVNLNMQVQNTTTSIKSFNGDISLMLKYAESKKSLYPGGVYIAYYDKSTGRIQIVNTQDLNGKAQSQISKTGEYVLIGKLIK